MFDIFVVRLYLLLPQFGHVVIAKQRAICCASRSPILSSHNNGAALFLVGVKQLHPSNLSRLFKMCSLCSLFLQPYCGEEKRCLASVLVVVLESDSSLKA